MEARCDYLDLCGEPQCFDEALIHFDRLARENGVLAIHAAAFDCVPAERELQSLQLLQTTTSNHGEEGEEEEQTTKKVECAGIKIVHTIQNVGTANATTFHVAGRQRRIDVESEEGGAKSSGVFLRNAMLLRRDRHPVLAKKISNRSAKTNPLQMKLPKGKQPSANDPVQSVK
mmetsp:Transcript_25243/g.43112  ORF Transcript_25243/g.43112 Transcript_25243/m.43112 type:complete len:173 (+) Transcript_25243:507-1025(+)